MMGAIGIVDGNQRLRDIHRDGCDRPPVVDATGKNNGKNKSKGNHCIYSVSISHDKNSYSLEIPTYRIYQSTGTAGCTGYTFAVGHSLSDS
jgi:hypothetical protein